MIPEPGLVMRWPAMSRMLRQILSRRDACQPPDASTRARILYPRLRPRHHCARAVWEAVNGMLLAPTPNLRARLVWPGLAVARDDWRGLLSDPIGGRRSGSAKRAAGHGRGTWGDEASGAPVSH